MFKRLLATLALTTMLGLTVACSPLERQAYNAVVASKAFLDVTRSNHPECANSPVPLPQVCALINRAVKAKDTMIDAAELYCAGPDFETGGTCNAPKKGAPGADQATAKLKAALEAYNQIAADLKGAL